MSAATMASTDTTTNIKDTSKIPANSPKKTMIKGTMIYPQADIASITFTDLRVIQKIVKMQKITIAGVPVIAKNAKITFT